MQVIVCESQTHDAQSPLLKHESPGANMPVHELPPLELLVVEADPPPEPIDPGHMALPIPPGFSHALGQNEPRHAAVDSDAGDGEPQAVVHAATVLP